LERSKSVVKDLERLLTRSGTTATTNSAVNAERVASGLSVAV
jgi:hypothetical protein